jgi:hypothetical protein
MNRRERARTSRTNSASPGRGRVVRTRMTAEEREKLARAKPTRGCFNCVYARTDGLLWLRTLMSGFPVLTMCANHPDAPGRMREVSGICPNYRMKKPRPPLVRTEPPPPPNDEIRYIPLTRGLYAIVDAADYEWLSKHKWCARCDVDGKRFYACRNDHGRLVLMHREIMKPPPGMVVDHLNRQSLDDRRCNLHICTPLENSKNSRRRVGKSGYIGVYRRGDKWSACYNHAGREYYLGLFDTAVEAARARDAKAIELGGPYVQLNFPPSKAQDK